MCLIVLVGGLLPGVKSQAQRGNYHQTTGGRERGKSTRPGEPHGGGEVPVKPGFSQYGNLKQVDGLLKG